MISMKDWKVLLIDDEEEFATTLAERLRIRGIQTTVALDGDQALKSIEMDPPQVVILDVLLPGISGLDLLKRIRKRYPQIEVIVITGRGMNEREKQQAASLGAHSELIKPVDIAHVFFEILDVLKIPKST